jgi:hypothetical protein
MHRLWTQILLIMAAVSLLACGGGANEPPKKLSVGSNISNRAPGEYIVTLVEGGAIDAVRKTLAVYYVLKMENLGKNRYLVKVRNDPGPEEMQSQLLVSPEVKAVQPNYLYSTNRPQATD